MSTSFRTRVTGLASAALLAVAPLAVHASAAQALPHCPNHDTPDCNPKAAPPRPCADRVSSTDQPDDSADPNQFHVLYVIPKGVHDGGAAERRSIQSQIVEAEAFITRRDPTRMIRFDWISRQFEPRKCLDISTIHTDLQPADISSSDDVRDKIVTAWNGPGQYNPKKSYLAFVEGTNMTDQSGLDHPKGIPAAGEGDMPGTVAAVDLTREPGDERAGVFVPLHEVLHNLGAVGAGAMHRTAGGHVNDDPHDVMSPSSPDGDAPPTLDTDGLDYWSSDPAKGGVLGDPRVIDFAPGPDTSPPVVLDTSPDAAAFIAETDGTYSFEPPAAWDNRAVASYEIGVRQLTRGDDGGPVRSPRVIDRVDPDLTGQLDRASGADSPTDLETGATYVFDVTALDAAGNRSTTHSYSISIASARPTSFSYAPILQSGGRIKPALPTVTGPAGYDYSFMWRSYEAPTDRKCSAHFPGGDDAFCPVPPGVTVNNANGAIEGSAPIGIPPTGYAVDLLYAGNVVATAQVVIGDPSTRSSRDSFSYDKPVPGTIDAYTDVYDLKVGDSTDLKPTVVVDHDPGTTYEVTGGTLPAGASLDPKTGAISVTNAAVGTTRVTVSQHSQVIWWFNRTATITIAVT